MNEANEKHTHHHYHITARSSEPLLSILQMIVLVLSVALVFLIAKPMILGWIQEDTSLPGHVMLDARELARVQQKPTDQLMKDVMKTHRILQKALIDEEILTHQPDQANNATFFNKILRAQEKIQHSFISESRALDKLTYRLSHSKQINHTQDRRDAHDHR